MKKKRTKAHSVFMPVCQHFIEKIGRPCRKYTCRKGNNPSFCAVHCTLHEVLTGFNSTLEFETLKVDIKGFLQKTAEKARKECVIEETLFPVTYTLQEKLAVMMARYTNNTTDEKCKKKIEKFIDSNSDYKNDEILSKLLESAVEFHNEFSVEEKKKKNLQLRVTFYPCFLPNCFLPNCS